MNSFNRDYFVYVLCDPRKPGLYTYGTIVFKALPFYVGKGKGRRPEAHVAEARTSTKKTHKLSTIRAILNSGEEPLVYKSQPMTEEEALAKEQILIEAVGRTVNGGTLTNATNGGDGISGHTHSADSRKRMSKAQKRVVVECPDVMEKRIKNLREEWDIPGRAETIRNSMQYDSETMSAAASRFWNNASKDAIAERNRKVSESHAKRSKVDKEDTANRKRKSWANHTKEQSTDIQNRRLQSLAQRSEEERARSAALQGAASRKRHETNRAKVLPEDLILKIRELHKNMSAVQIAKSLGIPYSRVRLVTTGEYRPDLQP